MSDMSNPDVSARALRAAGVPITLLDGRQVRLLFDLDAIAECEERFGSIGGMQDALKRIKSEGVSTQFFRPVLQMMRAALSHDPTARNALFDTAAIAEYFEAVMKAFQLAFPKGDPASNSAPTQPTTTASLGTPSITPPPSNTDVQTHSSGE
jgi:hypothetical protein